MATRTWLSISNDWNATANWSGGAVPVDNDVVVIPASATLAPTTNVGSQGAIDLTAFIVEEGCDVDVGSSGTPLAIHITTLKHFGNGTIYLAPSGTLTSAYIAAKNMESALTISSGAGNVFRLFLASGCVNYGNASASLLESYIVRHRNDFDAKLVFSTASTSSLVLVQHAGIVECAVDLAIVNITGGDFTYTASTGISDYTQTGGYTHWETTAGFTTQGVIMGGTLDVFTAKLSQASFGTVIWGGGQFLYDGSLTLGMTLYDIQQQIGNK